MAGRRGWKHGRTFTALTLAIAGLAVAQYGAPPTVTPATVDRQLTALGQRATVDWTNGLIVVEGKSVFTLPPAAPPPEPPRQPDPPKQPDPPPTYQPPIGTTPTTPTIPPPIRQPPGTAPQALSLAFPRQHAEPVVQQPDGQQARAEARQAALADAQALLTAAVWGLQVDSETVVRDYQAQGGDIRAKVASFLLNSRPLDGSETVEALPNGSLVYTVRVAARVYARDATFGGDPLLAVLAPFITSRTGSEGPSPLIAALRAGKRALEFIGRGVPIKASSLSVNAVGQGFQPCLVPKIIGEDGTVVFGKPRALNWKAVSEGVVAYARDAQGAAASGRLGTDETTSELDAVRVTGTGKCDIVIPSEAARNLQERNRETRLLDEFNVVITF
jgi:hypothetical protein